MTFLKKRTRLCEQYLSLQRLIPCYWLREAIEEVLDELEEEYPEEDENADGLDD